MQPGLKIAVGGKGGVGKTTISAVLAKLFADDGFDVLAIDADPNTNLASAFGMAAESGPRPLIEMKELIAKRTGTEKGSIGAYFRLNPKVSDLPEEHWMEIEGVKLLVLGGISQGGSGCACPEGAFLKALLTETILQRKEMVLVDLAAGPEFLGRASIQGIDALVVVVEPGSRSIETARNIARMGKELGVKQVAAILNKVREPDESQAMRSQLGDIDVLGSVDYISSVQQADLSRKSVFQSGGDLIEQVRAAKDRLTGLISARAEIRSGNE